MELSDQLVGLLGKPDSEPFFQNLVTELRPYRGSAPADNTNRRDFADHGFTIGGAPTFVCVIFHISTFAVKRGYRKPYTAVLPWGLSTHDNKEQVCAKLGVEPFKTSPSDGYLTTDGDGKKYRVWHEIYRKPPFEVHALFDSSVNDLSMFIVRLGYTEPVSDLLPIENQNESNSPPGHRIRRRSPRKPHTNR